MKLQKGTVKITSGQSLSEAVNAGGLRLVAVQFGSWTAADITFQASFDGVTYVNVYADSTTELTVKGGADRFMLILETALLNFPYFKIRSGTFGAAVNQAADRTLGLVFEV